MTDVSANRAARKYPRRIQVARVAWGAVSILFRFSPRPLWGWRRWLLRRFGATVGDQAHIHPTVRITMPWNLSLGTGCSVGDRAILYALGPIEIGARTTISQGAHLCAGTHDHRLAERPLLTPPIRVGADSWVAAEAFIGPGVTVGSTCIVGARAVVMRSVPNGQTVVGNPARSLE